MKEPSIKYAIFSQVNGEWRDEGFYLPVSDIPPEKQIATMRESCESENGRGTFRSFAFLDTPVASTSTEAERNTTAEALLGEKMG